MPPRTIEPEMLTGKVHGHLVTVASGNGTWLMDKEASRAWAALVMEAQTAGFRATLASAFRDYERQLAIWNGKASGQRPVLDEDGIPIDTKTLSPDELARAILQWSAIPGASRHHWGTDVDVYDAAAVLPDYKIQLTPEESETQFGPFHRWLDRHASQYGFYRPYDRDRGGVKPERWHISYGPLAAIYLGAFTRDVFEAVLSEPRLVLGDALRCHRDALYDRYVLGIAEYRIP